MLRTLMILGAATALMSGSALAQSVADPNLTSICLDPGGQTRPVTCRSQNASRINQREDICQCLHGGDQVTVPFCPRGVKPPAESAAFEHARRSSDERELNSFLRQAKGDGLADPLTGAGNDSRSTFQPQVHDLPDRKSVV